MKQLDIIELASENKLLLAPKNYLKETDLLKKNSVGKTTFQLLAQKGLFKQIPQDLITEKVLLAQDSVGATGIHYMAKSKGLRHLPQEFQGKKYLKLRDYFGLTVEDYTNYNIMISQNKIPKEHATRASRNCYDLAMEF
jgi:hypothetical protein